MWPAMWSSCCTEFAPCEAMTRAAEARLFHALRLGLSGLAVVALLSACQSSGPVQVLLPDEIQQQAQACEIQQTVKQGRTQYSACLHQVVLQGGSSTNTVTDSWSFGLGALGAGARKEVRVVRYGFSFTPAGGAAQAWRCERREDSANDPSLDVTDQDLNSSVVLTCLHDGPRGTERLTRNSRYGGNVTWQLGGESQTWALIPHKRWQSEQGKGKSRFPLAWCVQAKGGFHVACYNKNGSPGMFWQMPLPDADAARRAALLALAPLES